MAPRFNDGKIGKIGSPMNIYKSYDPIKCPKNLMDAELWHVAWPSLSNVNLNSRSKNFSFIIQDEMISSI
jgi:hypothetical protein